ncbi:beta strand repeat-containing protein [Variovorax rhizosphaerae]|uniref:YadA-like family protein n=1 Tax=Variovorax rhizosphaerae TaxID=1836200 RepID=A0ABU8WIS6_9BURK
MNKTFKSIWNDKVGAWVAVSETATPRGKSSRGGGVMAKPRVTAMIAALTGVFALTPDTQAQSLLCTNTGGAMACQSDSGRGLTFTANSDSGGSGENMVLRGGGAGQPIRNYFVGSADTPNASNITLGDAAYTNSTTTIYTNHFQVGDSATSAAGNSSSAIGVGAKSLGAESLALGARSIANAVNTVAIGTAASAQNENDLAVGIAAKASGGGGGTPAMAFGSYSQATGPASTAFGVNAIASGNRSAAFGYFSQATGDLASAFGRQSIATGNRSVAFGANTTAGNDNDVALGSGSTTAAPNTGTTAQYGATAAGIAKAASGTVSVGTLGNERQIQNVAAGVISATSTDAINGSQLNSVVKGVDAVGTSTASALGGGSTYDNTTGTVSAPSYTINNINTAGNNTGPTTQNNVGDALTALNNNVANTAASAVKYDTNPDGSVNYNSVSLNPAGSGPTKVSNVAAGNLSPTSTDAVNGSQLNATNANVTNLGNAVTNLAGDTSTTYTNAKGMGIRYVRTNEAGLPQLDAYAQAPGSTAVGYNATSSAANALALGRDTTASAINSVALGANAKATNLNGVAIGNNAASTGQSAFAIGNGTNSSGSGSLALGNGAKATNQFSLAMGAASNSTGNGSIAIGVGADSGTGTTYSGDIAFGYAAKVLDGGGASTAAGSQSTATSGASSFGYGSRATGTNASTFGYDTRAAGQAATALGYSASAGNANDIALGSRSVTAAPNTGVTALYGATAAGIADPADGVLSLGGGYYDYKRQIQNVAAGVISSKSTDAINGSQLYSVVQGVDAQGTTTAAALGGGSTYDNSTGAISAPSYTINNINQGGNVAGSTSQNNVGDALSALNTSVTNTAAAGVKYDTNPDGSINYNSVSLNPGGSGPTKVSNVAAGTLSATSTDAVNGSQLNATNTNVTNLGNTVTNLGDTVTTLGNTPITFAGNTGSVDRKLGETLQITGAATTAGTYSGANLKTTVVGNEVQIQMADAPAFSSLSTTGAVNVGGPLTVAGPTTLNGGLDMAGNKITNVAAGTANTDGVNVGQMNAATAAATASSVKYDTNPDGSTNYNSISLNPAGSGPTKISNVAAGALSPTSTDAVNGSQLNATNTALTNMGNAITNVAGDTSNAYTDVNGMGIRYVRTNEAGLPQIDSYAKAPGSTAVGYGATSSAADALALGRGATASAVNSVALGAGSVADGSTLGTAGYLVGGIATSEVNIGNRRMTGVSAGAMDTDGVNVAQLKAVSQAATAAANATAVQYDTNPDGSPNYNSVSLNPAGSGPTKVTNVAAGTLSPTSTDAVNGSQLNATNTNVTNLGNTVTTLGNTPITFAGNTGTYSGANLKTVVVGNEVQIQMADAPSFSSVTTTGAVNVGGTLNVAGATTLKGGLDVAGNKITNVGAGTDDTDAVNVAQLRAGQATAVKYEKNQDGTVNYNSVSLGGEAGGAPTAVHNVAAGVAGTDAVNVNQLNAGIASANQYTDARVSQVQANLDRATKDASAGTAGAMAMANLPQSILPGKSMMSAGVGAFDGQAAVAVGISKLSDNSRWIVKLSGTVNTRGKAGIAAGAGFQW